MNNPIENQINAIDAIPGNIYENENFCNFLCVKNCTVIKEMIVNDNFRNKQNTVVENGFVILSYIPYGISIFRDTDKLTFVAKGEISFHKKD